jgi:hypothetical protein
MSGEAARCGTNSTALPHCHGTTPVLQMGSNVTKEELPTTNKFASAKLQYMRTSEGVNTQAVSCDWWALALGALAATLSSQHRTGATTGQGAKPVF